MAQIPSFQHPGLYTDDRRTTTENEAQNCQKEAKDSFGAGVSQSKQKYFESDSPEFPFRERLVEH